MKNILSKFFQTQRIAEIFGIKEFFVSVGLAASGYGIALIYPPAAWIVIGAVIFLIGMRL